MSHYFQHPINNLREDIMMPPLAMDNNQGCHTSERMSLHDITTVRINNSWPLIYGNILQAQFRIVDSRRTYVEHPTRIKLTRWMCVDPLVSWAIVGGHCQTLPLIISHTAVQCRCTATYFRTASLPHTAALPDSRTLPRALLHTTKRTAVHCCALCVHTIVRIATNRRSHYCLTLPHR
jgi:hypothetical protein